MDKCAHGNIRMTCPTCKHAMARGMSNSFGEDDGPVGVVDGLALLDKLEVRFAQSALQEGLQKGNIRKKSSVEGVIA